MLKVGITGGIGSGKSTVAKIFKSIGIPILNADEVAKNILATNKDVQAKVMQAFGLDVFENGILQKKVLAAKAFASLESTTLLNSIIHPATIAYGNKWFINQKGYYAIKEAALLIETKNYTNLDFVIGVEAPLDIRIERVMQRDGLDKEAVIQRVNKQLADEEKRPFYNFIIKNNNEVLLPQVWAVHQQLITLSHGK